MSLLQLAGIVEASPFAIHSTDREGIVTGWNAAIAERFGFSVEDALGKPAPVVPDDARAEYARMLRQVVTEGVAVPFSPAMWCSSDGERVAVRVAMAPLREGAEVMGVVVYSEDITERQRAEQALVEQTHHLRAILDAIPAPVFYKDAAGVYRGCNKAFEAYLGKRREDIVGKDVYGVSPKDLADVYKKADDALFAARVPQIYEASVVYADGVRRDVMFHKATFDGPDGQLAGLIGTILDITTRKQAERALRESEERYRAVVSVLGEGIVLMGRGGKVLACNPAAESILGLDRESILAGVPWPTLSNDGAPLPFEQTPIAESLRSGASHSGVAVRIDRAGAEAWISLSTRPIFEPSGTEPALVVASFTDVTEKRVYEQRLEHHAYHDPLTGLPNRRLFMDRLERAIAAAHRRSGRVAVAFIDLDRFKSVNDSLGHDAGDRLLAEIAARLRRAVRDADTVAHVGGDEFCAIFSDVADVGAARAAAERLREAVAPPLALDGRALRVGASIGVALFPDDATDPGMLLRYADSAMYQAKSDGKNAVRSFTPSARDVERLDLEERLHGAVERGEMVLHYQPQIDLASGKVVGVEALVRWEHPALGLIAPARFIPVAEETGLMSPIGAWVLREACAQGAAWARQGKEVRIGVNMSVQQLRRSEILALVRDVLRETGLAPEQLELELTESMVVRASESLDAIHALRELGVRLVVDDFGTGYSSLGYLQELPIDAFKMDRSFVAAISDSADRPPLVRTMIALAQDLGLGVVAEGVETEAQLDLLRELGCDTAQGFLLGRPVPAELMSFRSIAWSSFPPSRAQLTR